MLRKRLILNTIGCIMVICMIDPSYSNPLFTSVSHHSGYFFPIVGIRINGGQKYTNHSTVQVEIKSLKLADSLIVEMKIGVDPELNGSEWIKYSPDKNSVKLSEGDGDKTIYAQLKDRAGNLSPIESNKIILDTKPPDKCKFLINQGEKYTNDEKKRVVLFIQAEEEISQMMFSNSEGFEGAQWEPFAVTKNWSLPENAADGPKTVWAKFMDPAGNIGNPVSASIILDTQTPTSGSVIINNGEKYTRVPDVVLKIKAADATLVRIVSPNNSEVIPYQTKPGAEYMEVNWKFDSLQGTKVVRVYFQDEAKNRTTQVIQDDIIYDSVGPVPPVLSINGDNKFTNDPSGQVNLKLTSKVNTADITMEISNFIDFHDVQPQPFRDNVANWKLDGQDDGLKTIYAKLFDAAGNESEIVASKIILDRVPPKVNAITINDGGKWATSPKVTVNMAVDDAASSQINNNELIIAKTVLWDPFQPKRVDWVLTPGEGDKTIYTRFKDAAGNVTDIIKTNVTLDTQPPTGSISIDNGAKFTNRQDKIVHLVIKSPDAKGMQISNSPDFSSVKLEPFASDVASWTLDGEDGPKTIFLRLKDEAGNVSPVYTSTIILDRVPPSDLNITLNEGQEWLRNPSRRSSVQVSATGAAMMTLSENPNFPEDVWTAFKPVTFWVFSAGEGEKELFARFKDAAGNISQSISAKIKLDYTPPVCDTLNINNGADFTNDPQKKVTLNLLATGAIKMAISNNSIDDPNAATTVWEDYKSSKDWILDGEDGMKTIYAVFRDEAGNLSSKYTARIILDRVGPSNCSMILNNGQKWVPPGGNKITMELTAEGADKMMIGEDPSFKNSKWELFTPKKVFEVSTGDGDKTIYLKFEDKAGNESQVISGKVSLDTNLPVPISLLLNNGIKYLNNSSKSTSLKVAAKDAVEMKISQKGFSSGKWEPYVTDKTLTLDGEDGEKVIAVFFRDEAGNISNPLIDSVLLDRTPPVPVSFTIDDGSGWTKNPDKKVTFHIKARDAQYMMIGNTPAFENGQWIPYSEEFPDYVLPGDDGEKTLYIKFKDDPGNISIAISAKIALKRSF